MALNMTGAMEEESEDPRLSFSTNIFEYKWPLGNPESPTYILQEQIAEYLEIRGFSRRYPGNRSQSVWYGCSSISASCFYLEI